MAGFSPGLAAWKTAFQLSPIILVNGIANFSPVKMLPLIAVSQAIDFATAGLTGGNISPELDDFFLNFEPMGGGTLISQQIAHYPFANLAVAANAPISQPLVFSMKMIAVASQRFGYFEKLAIMTAVAETLRAHNAAGGSYIVATPSFVYTDCLLLALRDISSNATHQPQNTWQLDFEKPLLTVEAAQSTLGGLFSLVTGGMPIPGNPATVAWSGLATGANVPGSLGVLSTIPASTSSIAAGTIPGGPLSGGGV